MSEGDIEALLALGQAQQAAGDAAAAEASFRRLVELAPDRLEGHFHLAALLAATGRHRDAVRAFERAEELAPEIPEVPFNRALALQVGDRIEEAVAAFARAIEINPGWPPPHRGLALLELGRGRREAARAGLQRCLELDPGDAAAAFHFGQMLAAAEGERAEVVGWLSRAGGAADSDVALAAAAALIDQKALDEGEGVARRIIALDPLSARAHLLQGLAQAAQNDLEGAEAALGRARELAPELAEVVLHLGILYRDAGRIEEARKELQSCLELAPEFSPAHLALGILEQRQGHLVQAIACFERVLAAEPDNIVALNNAGTCLQALGRLDEALQHLHAALAIDADQPEVLGNLAGVLMLLERIDEAAVFFSRLLNRHPDYSKSYPIYAHVLSRLCAWSNLGAVMSRLVADAKADIAAGRPVHVSPFGLHSLPLHDPALALAVARQTSSIAAETARQQAPGLEFKQRRQNRQRSHQRLRVGYLSPDFRGHSVGVAFMHLLDAHGSDLEWRGYSLSPGDDDGITAHLRQRFDAFCDLSGQDDGEAAAIIQADEIDILVDLAGHTRGARLGILAHEPAPVQAHFLGYGFTLGADYVPYLITDETTYPQSEAAFCSEALVYLPEHSLPAAKPPVAVETPTRAQAGLPEEGYVFANFNVHYKLEPEIFGLWMRILKRAPGSVLWLLSGSPTAADNLRREAQARGVDGNRLVFAERQPHPLHLARQRLADLMLDTLYHTGGVTSTEGLWAGVPLLSYGGPPNDRTGVSLLGALGLDEMICHDLEQYQQLAVALAGDPDRQATLKARLGELRQSAALFDMRRFAGHLETAYGLMWENHLAGRPPQTLRVPLAP